MMGPEWSEGCASCSFLADGIDGCAIHVAHRDVTLMAVSRAPLANIQAFKTRMGWRFPWASSYGNTFNADFCVSFTNDQLASGRALYNFDFLRFPMEEAPGLSVFYKNGAGEVFHTYSTYARGGEALIGTYHYLDFAPKGRDEEGLAFSMAWLRHHDRYDASYVLDTKRSYEEPARLKPGEMVRSEPCCVAPGVGYTQLVGSTLNHENCGSCPRTAPPVLGAKALVTGERLRGGRGAPFAATRTWK